MTDDSASEPIPAWVQTLGIVDRPTGIEKAHAARERLHDAATNVFGRGQQQWTTAAVLLSGLVTRAFGLHDAAVAALEADNPFAAFTLIRSYAENAAAVLYAADRPEQIDQIIGLDGYPPPVDRITAHADQERFRAFNTVYSDLSKYAHPFSLSITASMSVDSNIFHWSSTPAFKPGNDFITACAWIVEFAEANAHLFIEFADAQGW